MLRCGVAKIKVLFGAPPRMIQLVNNVLLVSKGSVPDMNSTSQAPQSS